MSSWPDRWSDVQAVPNAGTLGQTESDAIGHLDQRSLVLEGGVPQGFFLRGWAALRRGWSALGALNVWLCNERCSFLLGPAREARPDVAEVYGGAVSQHAGFRAFVPAEALFDGDFRVVIQLHCDGRSALLETGTSLSVREGQPCLLELAHTPLMHVVHVPKTGGTSFRAILEGAFGGSLALQYGARLLIDAQTRCIQGHNYASSFLRYRPETQLVMWFRDPVERVVSEYFHWRRHPDTHGLDGQTLLQFARRREMVNAQRRCLDRLPLSRIDCVCITERFRSSVELFKRMFEHDAASLDALNVNPDKTFSQRYDLPEELRTQLVSINLADYDLYARAEQRFAELCRQYGVEPSD